MGQKISKIIVGVDEAGRGPLAGPVIACAVTVLKNPKSKILNPKQILKAKFKILNDSKRTTLKKREEIFEILKKHPQVKWGIGRVSEKVIDRINILQAAKLAMKRAVRNLEKKIGKKADLLLIDGNFGIDLLTSQKSIIKGDEKVFLIKMASIIAKVTRDRAMLRHHKKYPQYGFDRHKGYPTKYHQAMLKKYSPCKLHRKSFGPVRKLLQN